ncbi:type I pantothenate kinase, partial [Patulibacter sp. S7RM1-6]
AADATPAAPGPGGGAIADRVDLGIYVDAAEEYARGWYLERFRAWRAAAADDPGALLHATAEMPDPEADALALRVWAETNAPNVRDHVRPTRGHADVVLEKGPDHRVERVLVRPV